MALKWWEKTVEYQFVLMVAQAKKLYLAPLDGNEERAGDAIFSLDHRWLLLEFKRDFDALSSEKDKFDDYAGAEKILSSQDGHHHLVYGSERESKLAINARTYFSGQSSGSDMLKSGIDFQDFKKYVEIYTKYKRGPQGGSGGGLEMSDFALVAGVNTDGNIAQCLSLLEFQQQLVMNLDKANSHTLTRTRSRPSMER